jgi:subfamily B ATP-binding cassette protein MsbA
MNVFWKYARAMARYRTMIVLSLVMATFSAGGIGVGLISMKPVLELIVRDGRSLHSMGIEFNEQAYNRVGDVVIRSPGLEGDAVAAQISKPIASQIAAIDGVSLAQSISVDNQSTVHVVIEPGITETGPIWDDVRAVLDGASLPAQAEQPRIEIVPGAGFELPQALIDALPRGRFNGVMVFLVGLGILTVLGGTANFLHQYFAFSVVLRTIANLRRAMFARVVHLRLADVVVDGQSNTISRVVLDTQALSIGFSALLGKGVAQLTKGLAGLIAAFILDWRLAGIAMLVSPIMYTIIRKLGKKIRRAARGALSYQADLYGAATEALQGLRVVKVHTTERYEMGRFHRMNKDVMKQMLRVRVARALASPLVEVLTVLMFGGLVMIAVKAIIDNELEFESFIATVVALGAAGASLKPLTGIIADIQQSAGAAQRIDEVFESEPEPGHERTLPKLPRHERSIAFDTMSFRYPTAPEPTLSEISLEIDHGERVAVVGPNGSGKTTLLAMVPRLFEPNAGCVRVDGHDIRGYSVRSLRRQIGVVTQETVIFRGTIRSNIAYGTAGVGDERIIAAAKQARAHEFIAALPDGYDTPVGEQGLTLSGGQRQRLAIARAILRDPAILILDEATSMIDADSEAKIAEAINEFAEGRTCLIVAHRLSTVLGADRIVVIDAGRIADVGTHDELLERCATYQLIARNQLVRGSA